MMEISKLLNIHGNEVVYLLFINVFDNLMNHFFPMRKSTIVNLSVPINGRGWAVGCLTRVNTEHIDTLIENMTKCELTG